MPLSEILSRSERLSEQLAFPPRSPLVLLLKRIMPIVASDDLLHAAPFTRFSCSRADGAPLRLPRIPLRALTSPLTWNDVAIGMLLREAHASGLQHNLLQQARSTWLPRMANVALLVLADCPTSADAQPAPQSAPPAWMQTPEVNIAWRCYSGEARPGRTLWKKTQTLLVRLHSDFPLRQYYLKVDVDALLLPRSLMQYLRYLHEASSASPPVPSPASLAFKSKAAPPPRYLYFGSHQQVNNFLFCTQPHCLFRSSGWRTLRAAYNRSLPGRPHARPSALPSLRAAPSLSQTSYAAGGVYGFSRDALGLLVAHAPPTSVAMAGAERAGYSSSMVLGSCLRDAAAAVETYRQTRRIPHLAEDELVGLCMRLYHVPLIHCDCFYQYGPCDVNNFSTCEDNTPGSRLCRLPISIHKIRRAAWYRPWFEQLRAREGPHLAELA